MNNQSHDLNVWFSYFTRVQTLTKQYTELENEFRMALQIEAERFREVSLATFGFIFFLQYYRNQFRCRFAVHIFTFVYYFGALQHEIKFTLSIITFQSLLNSKLNVIYDI